MAIFPVVFGDLVANGIEVAGFDQEVNTVLGRIQPVGDLHGEDNEAVLPRAPPLPAGRLPPGDALPTVEGQESHLVPLFQNLIVNAIKFHGADPPRIHVQAAKEREEWVFSVRDNGIGIDPKYAERIFQVFQRLHSRDQYPGTEVATVTPHTVRRSRRSASPPSARYSRCAAALSLRRTAAAMSARSLPVTGRPSAWAARPWIAMRVSRMPLRADTMSPLARAHSSTSAASAPSWSSCPAG